MKYVKIIDKILGQKTKVKILRYLVTHQDEQSGRHIAKAAGVNHWQCHKVLQEFYKQGLLKMRRAGNTYLFTLKRHHYFVEKAIIPLFRTEASLVENLVGELKKIITNKLPEGAIKSISSLILFGSISKGKEKPHSDIDILVVIKDNKKKEIIAKEILRNNEYFQSRYGNTLSPYVVTEDSFLKRYKNKNTLITNIVKHGNVLFGKTIGELIVR